MIANKHAMDLEQFKNIMLPKSFLDFGSIQFENPDSITNDQNLGCNSNIY